MKHSTIVYTILLSAILILVLANYLNSGSVIPPTISPYPNSYTASPPNHNNTYQITTDPKTNSQTITFTTTDTPTEIQQFYLTELTNEGWKYEKPCRFYWKPGFMATLKTERLPAYQSLTSVRLEIHTGRLSCDYIP